MRPLSKDNSNISGQAFPMDYVDKLCLPFRAFPKVQPTVSRVAQCCLIMELFPSIAIPYPINLSPLRRGHLSPYCPGYEELMQA